MANFADIRRFGDPSRPEWQKQNLKTIVGPNGQKWQVFAQAAPAFEGLLKDLHDNGYDAKSSGGFNYRTIRGSNKLSQHAFGNAIDINAATNPMLRGQLKTDMPATIAEIAAKHGLEWGGNWKNRPDPMHFEWKGMNFQPPTGQPMQMPAGTNDAPANPMGPQAFAQAGAGASTPMTMPDLPIAPAANTGMGDFLASLAKVGSGSTGQQAAQPAPQAQGNELAERSLAELMGTVFAPSQGAATLAQGQPGQAGGAPGAAPPAPFARPQIGTDPRMDPRFMMGGFGRV